MVNKCVSVDCMSGYKTGEKKFYFNFPGEKDLNENWIYFQNRKNWLPSKISVICIDHFKKKFIKMERKNVG